MRVGGIDRARGRWFGVALEDGVVEAVALDESLASVCEQLGECHPIAVDVPIGLTATTRRRCDVLVRELLGRHGSRIFVMPPEPVLAEGHTHAEAARRSRELTGAKISKQAYNLFPQVREARALAERGIDLIEAHPETSFAVWNGCRPVAASKRTWGGLVLRLDLLGAVGVPLPPDLGDEGASVAPDDVVDALACACTARDRALQTGRWLPPEPDPDAAPGPPPRIALPSGPR